MRGYNDAMASSVPSIKRVVAASPLIFVLGGTVDLLISDDGVSEVALRGLFVVAVIIVVALLANAAEGVARRQARER